MDPSMVAAIGVVGFIVVLCVTECCIYIRNQHYLYNSL